MELIRARAQRQGVQVDCEMAARPLMIEADHEQLRQLFLNLLLNALDALPQGGSIRVAAMESAGEDSTSSSSVIVTVTDSGPGIPADLGDQIFAPYVSTKDAGLGLGLAISKQIVQSHGGEIIASNTAKGGAIFTIRLPRLNLATDEIQERASS